MDSSESPSNEEHGRAEGKDLQVSPTPNNARCEPASRNHDFAPKLPASHMRWFQAALLAGTVLRMVTIPLSSPDFNLPFVDTSSWAVDHVTYVVWAQQATSPEQGLLSMYTEPHGEGLEVSLPRGQKFVQLEEGGMTNYPPLSLYVIWLQGKVYRFLDPEMVANTVLARVVFHAVPFIGDIVLAIGVWTLCFCVFDRRTAVIATTVVYLIPPIWLDSCWWGQTDSWEMAPMVWVVWAM
ncbi:MAG: hypothetical protein IH987_22030, partial [Planctomycetes bacterium]|nr:hypothetical protein [Planctomycetota bacterium]